MNTRQVHEVTPTDTARAAIAILAEQPDVLVYTANFTALQIRGALCNMGKAGIYRTSSYREGCYISRNDNSK